MTAGVRDPVHKTRVYKVGIAWYAECETCPKALQQPVSNWFSHWRWIDALDTALRHNSSNKWMQT